MISPKTKTVTWTTMNRRSSLLPQKQSPNLSTTVGDPGRLSLCANVFPVIPYISDEHAEAATKNSILKLMFRLLKFTVYDDSPFFREILSSDQLISL